MKRPHEVKILLDAGADSNAPGEYGERPLQVAVSSRNSEIIEQLLRAGARPELKDDKGIDVWEVAEAWDFKEKFEEIARRVAPSQHGEGAS